MYKIKKTTLIFNVCLHILRIHVISRENRSYGDFNTCFDPRARLLICAADSVSSPHPLNRSASFLRLRIFHCPSFSILSNGFERRRTCLYCYMCAPFLPFFLTQVFTTFHICASRFSPSFPFLSYFSFISFFTRTSFIVLNFILLRASSDATMSLSVLIFIRLNPRATSGFFHLMYLFTPLPPP